MEADAVLLLIVLHAPADRLPGIVQAALHGAIGYALDLGDLAHGQLIEIVHQHRGPLLFRQLPDDAHDRLPEFRLLVDLRGDGALALIGQGVEEGMALLVLLQQDLLLLAEPAGAAAVGDPQHPGDEGGGLLQISDGADDLQEGLLGDVAGQIGVLHGLQGEVVYIVIKCAEQLLHGGPVALLGGGHQRSQLIAFHHSSIPLSFLGSLVKNCFRYCSRLATLARGMGFSSRSSRKIWKRKWCSFRSFIVDLRYPAGGRYHHTTSAPAAQDICGIQAAFSTISPKSKAVVAITPWVRE